MIGAARRLPPQRNRKPALGIQRGHLGVNYGNAGTAALASYEAWLGRPVDSVNIHTGRADSSDYTGSIGYVAGLYAGCGRAFHWSLPMFWSGGSLSSAASGSYDAQWRTAAQEIVKNRWPKRGPLLVRTGWEFNLSGQPWYCVGSESTYVTAWRRMVDIFRTVSPDFLFIWCPNFEDSGNDPELAWPGRGYVDLITQDFYVWMGGGGFTGNPSGAYSYYNSTSGSPARRVPWVASFARSQNLPYGIDEWGASGSDFGPYITSFYAYFKENDWAFTKWWESNDAYTSILEADARGTTSTQYRTLFGASAGTPWTPTQLDNVHRWIDAKTTFSGTSDGTAVASWTDLSANASHYTATGTTQPLKQTLNSNPTIVFDGSDDVMIGGNSALGTTRTTIAALAYKTASTTGTRHLHCYGSASAGQERAIDRIGSPANTVRCSVNGSGNDHDAAVVWADDTPVILVWDFDPAATSMESSVRINGATAVTFNATGTSANTSSANAYLGGRNGAGSENWRGGIMAMVTTTDGLTTQEAEKLEGYLAHRYGVTSILDSGHPYKSVAPTV